MSQQPLHPPESQKETLDRLLALLRGPSPAAQLDALNELATLNFSSQAVLGALEQLVLHSPDPNVRAAARDSLDTAVHRFVRRQGAARLGTRERSLLLGEIQGWQKQGILSEDQLVVLASRYGFDLGAAPALPQKAAPLAPEAPAPKPEVPAGPRPTLTQTLLSETSIRIALYLGAFLVIAAAAILAALMEAVRLPILGAVTAAFAAGAGLIRRRLPQPGFVLFIVFSCMLPFDAAVLSETLRLSGQATNIYWTVTYLLLAVVWIGGTWFFTSRFFSIAAFVALELAVSYSSQLGPEGEVAWLIYGLLGLAGLGGVAILQRWKDRRFALPLFVATLLHTIILIVALGGYSLLRDFRSGSAVLWPGYWVVACLAWISIAVYFVVANKLYPFPFCAPAAVLVLLPIPLTFLQLFDPSTALLISGLAAWGALYALFSEVFRRIQDESIRPYHSALLFISYLPLLSALIWAALESPTLEFAVSLLAVLTFLVLTLRRPARALTWGTALVAAVVGLITFFQLPLMARSGISAEYPLTAAAVLLLLPDLFLHADLAADKPVRWPPRLIGLALAAIALLYLASGGFLAAGNRALVWGLSALVALGYALRYKKPWMPYVFAALLPFAVLETLSQFHSDLWLPVLVTLAAVYYLGGSLLTGVLAAPLRYSGLALGSLVTAVGLVNAAPADGWYSLLVALLFAAELYRFKAHWAEVGVSVFASAAWWLVAPGSSGMAQLGYRLTGMAAIWSVVPLVIEKTYRGSRPLTDIINGLAVALALGTAITLFVAEPRVGAICFSVLASVSLANALIRRWPLLAYGFAAALALAVLFALRAFNQTGWLFPMIGLAILYYAAGFVLRRHTASRVSLSGWASAFLCSALGLAIIVALSAPLERSGLPAAIPVALAATLWTMEAFIRRNVWLGFPSNGLYLLAYFILLSALKVEEPQLYSVVAAALGMLMHYLLSRSGSRTGAFITGMVSQLVLLSTTYLQMLSTEKLIFFAVLFFQGLAVLAYGLVIRSRSLVITPIAFVVVGVMTVLYSALKGISSVVLIGCSGIILLMLGILAVVLRERITRISERISAWQA